MRPKAEILTIGDELLKGSTLNSNAQFLGRGLTELGFEVARQTACRDQIPEILACLRTSLNRADLVVLSGGLGPTPDDVTRDAVAAYFSVPLKFSARQFSFIRGYYRKRRRAVPPIVKKEAMFPANAVPLFNTVGIALGFYVVSQEKLVVVVPGVPYEMEKMFCNLVAPVVRKHFKNIPKKERLIVKTVGLAEPAVMQKLGRDFFNDPFEFGIYPSLGEVTLRLYAESKKIIQRLRSKVKKRLGHSVYAYEEKNLAQVVGELLVKKRRTLAVAESCTGGLLASQITQVAGASRYFRGGITVYHPDLKKYFGVPSSLLKQHGAISPQTARALAHCARAAMKADYGISITGVAGPSREEKKPVGRVYLALAEARRVKVWEENFLGDRVQIQAKAAKKALEYLWQRIR